MPRVGCARTFDIAKSFDKPFHLIIPPKTGGSSQESIFERSAWDILRGCSHGSCGQNATNGGDPRCRSHRLLFVLYFDRRIPRFVSSVGNAGCNSDVGHLRTCKPFMCPHKPLCQARLMFHKLSSSHEPGLVQAALKSHSRFRLHLHGFRTRMHKWRCCLSSVDPDR